MPSRPEPLDDGRPFYRQALELLEATGIPYLVGGAYAFASYTGIHRDTRDFDVFCMPEDAETLLDAFAKQGYRTEFTFRHWLAKVYHEDHYVDLIFSSGNGVARVDALWFEHAVPATVLDVAVRLCPVEEMIWSKAFIMERERFDGADVAHLIKARATTLDWKRLVARFGRHSRVLLAHLLLFGYIYPGERPLIPRHVIGDLLDRRDDPLPANEDGLCQGTLLSRSQFLPDLERGYRDARLVPEGNMSRDEIHAWTEASRLEAARVTDAANGTDRPARPRPLESG